MIKNFKYLFNLFLFSLLVKMNKIYKIINLFNQL